MKICIIGGGISGLYLASCLIELGHEIDVYEKQETVGGRIMTCKQTRDENSIIYEAGAGRFNKSHKRLIQLLKKLNLHDKVRPINSQRTFKVNSREHNYNQLINETLFKDILLSDSTNSNKKYLKTILLNEYMNTVIGKRKTKQIINAFGYNSEFELQNAYTSLKIFQNDFNDRIQYYFLQDGLVQIIESLRDQIQKYKKGRLFLNTDVIDYNSVSNVVKVVNKTDNITRTARYDKVVFCVTKQSLLKYSQLLQDDNCLYSYLNNSIEMAPLHRIFAQFPFEKDGSVWFHDVNRTTTNLPIRYVIPLNAKTGLIQISYTDKQFADYWNSFSNDNELIEELMNNLKVLYPNKTISRPLWVRRYYWKEGATYWKPNYKTYRNDKNRNYLVAGEMTSQFHSGWIEGALESVDKILKVFKT